MKADGRNLEGIGRARARIAGIVSGTTTSRTYRDRRMAAAHDAVATLHATLPTAERQSALIQLSIRHALDLPDLRAALAEIEAQARLDKAHNLY